MPSTPCELHQPVRAAQYVRMSTEHQKYSIANQSAAILLYANSHAMEIVRSYCDAGKSGLHIKGRDALQELIATVESGHADFESILVYDVSRWGRFQDIDEAAHYEFLCKRAGIRIHYCAEQFGHENSSITNLLKSIKRTMAAEYSRELSVKVYSGQCRIANMGYSVGGCPPFGMRRCLVDANGVPKFELHAGQRKALHTDRVVLVPGPQSEIRVIRKIFDLITKEGMGPDDIARRLNRDEIPSPKGKEWMRSVVWRILTNPKYMGDFVWSQRNHKLSTSWKWNPQKLWVVKPKAIIPLISPAQFALAQERLRARSPKFTNEELLDILRKLWQKKGTLSMEMLGVNGIPSHSLYRTRFGSLSRAYQTIGFVPRNRHLDGWGLRSQLKQRVRLLLRDLATECRAAGATVQEHLSSGRLIVNGFGVQGKIVSQQRDCHTGYTGWLFKIDFKPKTDILLYAQLDHNNDRIAAYYIFPHLKQLPGVFWKTPEQQPICIEAYRVQNFDVFVHAMAHCLIPQQEIE